ncbi:hypothetical protein GGI12_000376 [Dipsacomyces acuminosporus]|nr:hypothetical protein GGI12_000376 [Dipsacomyces acuminosporus]
MKFTSVAAILALAVATQAAPVVVTVYETAKPVVVTPKPANRVHVVTKYVYANAGSNNQAPAPTAPAANNKPKATTPAAPAAGPAASNHPSSSGSANWIVDMLCRVNAVRAAHGVQPLGLSPELSSIAQKHSNYMDSVDSMTHADTQGSLGTRLSREGTAWSGAAENIASGMGSPQQAQKALEDSPSHLANMISANMAYFGAGASNGFYTQNFYALPGNTRPNNVPSCN